MWYKNTNRGWLNSHPTRIFYVNKITKPNHGEYAYVNSDIWNDSDSTNDCTKNFIPATDKEVETALIKEAKKRGFKKGCRWDTGCTAFDDEKFRFFNNKLLLQGGTIFKDGKWAEIIKDKVPTINGFEMEVNALKVKFGCFEFNVSDVKNLYNKLDFFNKHNPKIDSFKIDDSVITINELKEVVEYLNKKQ